MADIVLGVVCAAGGALVALFGAGILVFGCWVVVFSGGGGWWIASVVYLLFGAGVGFVGWYCARYGVRLIKDANAGKRTSVQDRAI
jgi:hypothetical protein